MKKTLFTLASLAASALFAQGASLVSDWNGFDSMEAGGLTISTNGSTTHHDETLDMTILHVSGNSGNQNNRPTVDLTSLTNDDALSLSGGLTFSLMLKGGFASGWDVNYMAGSAENNSYAFAFGLNGSGKGDVCFNGSTSVKTEGLSSETIANTVIPQNEYVVITYTAVTVGDTCNLTLYMNGEEVVTAATTNLTLANEALTRISFGGWSGASNNSRTSYDLARFAIYDGAMNAAEVQSLSNNWLNPSQAIPEPATATLSLLALAGLAARRRRK